MNPLYKKFVSTLIINNGIASITDIKNLPSNFDYCISGIPIMRNGEDVKFASYVTGQGWDASPLYATWHVFIGLKKNSNIIYIMGMKTSNGYYTNSKGERKKTSNMILTAEAYRKFKALGMYDVIKLDGGGSLQEQDLLLLVIQIIK